MFSRLNLVLAAGILALGAVVAAGLWAADEAPKAEKSCCDAKMACCADGGSACCAATDRLGCCEKGKDCCRKDQACCASPQLCCDEGKVCCDEGKACCGPANDTKLTAATGTVKPACCASGAGALAKTAGCCAAKAGGGEAVASQGN